MALTRIILFAAALLPIAWGDCALADRFELNTGGTITGEIVDRGEKGEFVVKTTAGALVTLTKQQVQRVEHEDPLLQEYETRSRSMPDTVAAHRELSEWCKQARLSKLVDHHQQRILELDPSDEQARESLGYQKHQGQWLTRDEIMTQRGLVFHEGDYRTPQDIALREREKQREEAEAEWLRTLRRWRDWLDGRRSTEAAQQIAAIDDPYAADAIVKLLEQEKDLRVRDLLTKTLAGLQHPLAVTTLVDLSLEDPDREVRLQCLDYLVRYHAPLQLTPYVSALRDKDNEIVNRAAEALETIGNPAALSPLIDALITRHKYVNTNAPPGNLNPTFDPSGGSGGLSVGGKSPVVSVDQKNIDVRQALVELSGGQDFGFDKRAWRRWFVNQQVREFVDARRDH
ncbi:MAG: HEAT repeat domain-containing protein [Planctomycetales bacterium]|nr:HEAT repeat domain-containing protein [Planctomycetales bacterium]